VDPWYFLQDDNYAQFTPTILSGLELWYQGKGFPTYNPYQMGGVPTLSFSTYSFLHPITHLAYAVARFGLGNSYHFNSVFALFYFALGYYFFYRLLRLHRIPFWMALLSALLFTFSGFNLVGARSWYYMAPTIGIFPLLLYLWTLPHQVWRSYKSKAAMVLLLWCYFNSGNFQMCVYSMLLLFFWMIGRERRWTILKPYLFYFFLFLGSALLLSSPLLLTTYLETKHLLRDGCNGCNAYAGKWATLGIPLDAPMPCGFGASHKHQFDKEFYAGGGIIFFLSLLFFGIKFIRDGKRLLRLKLKPVMIWLLLFLFCWFLSWGEEGIIWNWQCQMPLLKAFTMPCKMMLYVQVFGIIGGTKIVSLFLVRKRSPFWSYLFGIYMSGYLLMHVANAQQALFYYEYDTPYACFPWSDTLAGMDQGRVLSITVGRSIEKGYEGSLNHNFPTICKSFNLQGYEPLEARKVDPYPYFSELGGKYVLISNAAYDLWEDRIEELWPMVKGLQAMDTVYVDSQYVVLENKNYTPFLFESGPDTIRRLSFIQEVRADGLQFKVPSEYCQKNLTINYQFRPGIQVFINGKKKQVLPDEYNRIYIEYSGQLNTVDLRYNPYSLEFYQFHWKSYLMASHR
jgi:hypothetical protein